VTAHLQFELRRAIAWIAIYALALQTILGSVAPHPAIAFDRSLPFDPASIICLTSHSGDTGNIPGDEAPGSHAGTHCALCAPSSPPLPSAQIGDGLAVELTASEPAVPQPLLIPPLSKIASRPGGPRAPPMIA
jgi:hypothetical protein